MHPYVSSGQIVSGSRGTESAVVDEKDEYTAAEVANAREKENKSIVQNKRLTLLSWNKRTTSTPDNQTTTEIYGSPDYARIAVTPVQRVVPAPQVTKALK